MFLLVGGELRGLIITLRISFPPVNSSVSDGDDLEWLVENRQSNPVLVREGFELLREVGVGCGVKFIL